MAVGAAGSRVEGSGAAEGDGGIRTGGVVAASSVIAGLELMTNWAVLFISLRSYLSSGHTSGHLIVS